MPKCLVSHYTEPATGRLVYVCREGLNATKLSIKATRCWRHNCPGIRELPKPVPPTTPICNYLNCNKPVRLSQNLRNTKYCSQQCKSRESSRVYRMKKKDASLQLR